MRFPSALRAGLAALAVLYALTSLHGCRRERVAQPQPPPPVTTAKTAVPAAPDNDGKPELLRGGDGGVDQALYSVQPGGIGHVESLPYYQGWSDC